MIEHTVPFSLKHGPGSEEERLIFAAAKELASISGVRDFEVRRQVGAKHPHSFGITMQFEPDADYESYNNHPLHKAFIEERWLKEVDGFKEADLVVLK